jgi:hypothetical protein
MAGITLPSFTWGSGGQKLSASEVQRQRQIAQALAQANTSTPKDLGEGLNAIGRALAFNAISSKASEAEELGREAYSSQLAALGDNPDRSQLMALLDNDWASPGGSAVAQSLLQQELTPTDPLDEIRLQQAQFDLEQDRAGSPQGEAPSSVREWEYFSALPPEQQSEYLRMKRSNPYLDVGTGFVAPDPVNPGGTLGEPITKDLRGKEAQEAIGAAEGAAVAGAAGDIAAGETALDLIAQIKTHPELPNATGFTSFANAIPGTPRYGFQNLVEQAKSGAFLTAIQEMRGMGSLSNAEGQTATAAVTRMNTALSKDDFLKAVADYEAIIERGVKKAKEKLASVSSPAANPDAVVVDGFTIEAVD